MFMQHAGVQKAKGTVDFWKATLVSQSMKCGLCRGPCKGNGKHLLNISIRSNSVNGEMYFLAYPLLTSIHVDIIQRVQSRGAGERAASGRINGLSVLPKDMSDWVDIDSDLLATQCLTCLADCQSAAPASPPELLTIAFFR